MVANVCNYFYQIIMGGLLPTADYGTLNALFSLAIVVSVPVGSLQLIASKYTAHYLALDQQNKVGRLFQKLLRLGCVAAGVIFVVGLCLTIPISNLLQIDQKGYIIAVMAVVSINSIVPITNGTLQGAKRFFAFSMSSVIGTLFKLVVSVALVWLGLGLYGNIFGLWTGSASAIVYGLFLLRGYLKKEKTKDVSIDAGEIRHFFQHTIWAQLITALLVNGDILLIKIFAQDPTDVGIYSSGMVIGKISMYMATAVISVFFPLVAEQQAKGVDTRPLFWRALLVGGGLAVACALGMYLFGGSVIVWLFGQRYAQASLLQVPISCFVVSITLISILMNYVTARGDAKVFTISMGVCFLLIIALVSRFHENISQMLYILSSVLAVTFLVNLLSVVRHPVKEAASV